MSPAEVDDVGMDFVRHDDQVVLDNKRRNGLQLRPRETAPGGILRVAEDHHLCTGIDGCREVEPPARTVVAHGVRDQVPAGILDGAHERRIGRKLQ